LSARAERDALHPGRSSYFFALAFLAFFALAFFAFLAIVSSQGLMDWTRLRGMHCGGGPTSQHPRHHFQQIRGVLPPAVTALSSCYPQLLCVFGRIFWNFHAQRPSVFISRWRSRA